MPIAIVSLACRYPEANDSAMLWENVLAGRRSFRAIPSERLDLSQYAADLVGEAESITGVKAGLLADWQFDCTRFRIPQPVFEATDLTHWLALEVASEAIEHAGGIADFDRSRTAVVVANTLTGEFSRAAMLRLRAPFLDDLLHDAMSAAGLDQARAGELRRRFFVDLRERFPAPQEDMLAGGLANTIAGRVANFFDLHGGAYTVDAACASSLVGLANAADLLNSGAVDTVVVGAVDLSLDPFELVGFSRNGALAAGDMRVFDARSAGFWPGEGAGFAVLMREAAARERDLPVRAVLRGWGISTDGAGGFTRPAVAGQVLALQRAYERAAVDVADVGYVEAHGTGTAVGDPVEVRALATLRNGASRPLPVGSIKANIGHTKAAAGFAGLIKTVHALESGIVPPHVGCAVPHPVFAEVEHRVAPALVPQAFPANGARLAGVSAFGFGGINAHVVLERSHASPARALPARPRPQDAELFVFAGSSRDLSARLNSFAARASSLTLAELTDAAADRADCFEEGPVRAAVVAADPSELADKLRRTAQSIEAGTELLDADGAFVARRTGARLGFLFPGQAAPCRPDGGAWARRFDAVRDLLAQMPLAAGIDSIDTRTAQPTIAAASLAAWRVLRACGVEAEAACGHSLGELVALAWAGAIREDELVPLAAARGAIMATLADSGGGMLRIGAPPADVLRLIDGLPLVIACHNGPQETVVAGPLPALERAALRTRKRGLTGTPLNVSHAFHSPLMAPAVPTFAATLGHFTLASPRRTVWSTISGDRLDNVNDLAALLSRQLVEPVQFEQALRHLMADTDFLIEVGPGTALGRLAREAGRTTLSVDAFSESLKPLLSAIGFAFALGQPVDVGPLFRDRATRPIDLAAAPRLLANPCGRRAGASRPRFAAIASVGAKPAELDVTPPADAPADVLALVRGVIAEETGFAASAIRDDDRFLDDLHLNSIAVGRMVTKAARLAGIRLPAAPSEFANATAKQLAAGLIALRDLAPQESSSERTPGVRPWVRTFEQRWGAHSPARSGVASAPPRWRAVVLQGSARDREDAARLAPHDGAADGLLIWIGAGADFSSTYELFAACRAVWPDRQLQHLAICHAGAPVSAFARSLQIEGRFRSVRVVERSGDDPTLVGTALDRDIDGFGEVRIAPDGTCSEPYFTLATPMLRDEPTVTAADVILVTGAKGIGAECALRLARTGATLIFCGRSPPHDPAVTATLARARALGARCCYVQTDVTDAEALRAGVAAAMREVGAVTMLLHVAGMNEPHLFQEIDDAELRRTLAPKTTGFLAAVAAAGPAVRRIVSFGSILGRIGLKGETHYAIANAWQSALADTVAAERPHCSVLSLEWSIWNGAGMGHRLGSLERLARYGVDAIALDDGLAAFERLAMGGATGALIVTSRFGPPSYVALEPAELPLRRFLDHVLVHYPRLELVVETELSLGRDPYLADHRIDGLAVLPGVIALEAMTQVAGALVEGSAPLQIENAVFAQAIVVPERGTKTIRIMALAAEDGRVEVAIRGADDATDCARATFRFAAPAARPMLSAMNGEAASIDAASLYGRLLFQGPAFRRLDRYQRLSARRVAASLLPADRRGWFAPFEPQHLALGDPGVRDALLHALQPAVPHLRVVPVSVGRIVFFGNGAPIRLEAVETSATSDTFTFDIAAFDAAGALVEHWQGAKFQAIGEIDVDPVIAAVPEIAAPYVERVARAATNEASIEVALVGGADRDERKARALAVLDAGQVFARADGKPLSDRDIHLSFAHCGELTLAVKAACDVGCDLEAVRNGHADHEADAGLTAELTASGAEQRATAATRVWALHEVAVKQNRRADLPCRIARARHGEVVTFETAEGPTVTIHVPGLGGLVFAVGTSGRPAEVQREAAE